MVTNDITEVLGMGSYLNPGCKGFEESLNSAIYVDKTGLIEKVNAVVDTRQKYICVSRPRRFGKSMATDMLAAYYDQSVDTARLFDTLQIAKAETYQKYRAHWMPLYCPMITYSSHTVDFSPEHLSAWHAWTTPDTIRQQNSAVLTIKNWINQ